MISSRYGYPPQERALRVALIAIVTCLAMVGTIAKNRGVSVPFRAYFAFLGVWIPLPTPA